MPGSYSQLWEVEEGEGGVSVYGTNYDITTLLNNNLIPRPFSRLVLIAWSIVRLGEGVQMVH